jgi:hypothetical protein
LFLLYFSVNYGTSQLLLQDLLNKANLSQRDFESNSLSPGGREAG